MEPAGAGSLPVWLERPVFHGLAPLVSAQVGDEVIDQAVPFVVVAAGILPEAAELEVALAWAIDAPDAPKGQSLTHAELAQPSPDSWGAALVQRVSAHIAGEGST